MCYRWGAIFYGVDERTLPTVPAYAIGCELGDALLNEYIREEQRYPEEFGLSCGQTTRNALMDNVLVKYSIYWVYDQFIQEVVCPI